MFFQLSNFKLLLEQFDLIVVWTKCELIKHILLFCNHKLLGKSINLILLLRDDIIVWICYWLWSWCWSRFSSKFIEMQMVNMLTEMSACLGIHTTPSRFRLMHKSLALWVTFTFIKARIERIVKFVLLNEIGTCISWWTIVMSFDLVIFRNHWWRIILFNN